MVRSVSVRVYIIHRAVQSFLMQRLVVICPPPVPAPEFILIRVAGIVHMRYRHWHSRAVHHGITVQVHHVPVDQAHLPRARSARADTVICQVFLQAGQGGVGHDKIRTAVRGGFCGIERRVAALPEARMREHHAEIASLIPFLCKPCYIKRCPGCICADQALQHPMILRIIRIICRHRIVADSRRRPVLRYLPRKHICIITRSLYRTQIHCRICNKMICAKPWQGGYLHKSVPYDISDPVRV